MTRAVSERDRGGSVPRLHQRSVVLVERALVFVHVRIAGPCFRNQHRHYVGQGTAGLEQELNGVVERSRVAALRHDHRKQLVDLLAVQRAFQDALPRIHPADVAADGVDFAVVRNVAIRVRQLPARKRVGGEALVNQGKRAGHERIGQLEVEAAQSAEPASGPCKRSCGTRRKERRTISLSSISELAISFSVLRRTR